MQSASAVQAGRCRRWREQEGKRAVKPCSVALLPQRRLSGGGKNVTIMHCVPVHARIGTSVLSHISAVR